jgi:hypothetical protein
MKANPSCNRYCTVGVSCLVDCLPARFEQEVEIVYSQAFEVMPSSAQLHWFASQFVRQHKLNRHIEHLHLRAAEVCVHLCCRNCGIFSYRCMTCIPICCTVLPVSVHRRTGSVPSLRLPAPPLRGCCPSSCVFVSFCNCLFLSEQVSVD